MIYSPLYLIVQANDDFEEMVLDIREECKRLLSHVLLKVMTQSCHEYDHVVGCMCILY